ncbi:MAG: tyrosine recombinase XerD [Lachnospiraceae bacterium]|nr:tyrosine recombinase XerD [Lachnospiraceae bacterium]
MEETINQFVSFLRDIKHVSENTAISYKRDLMKMGEYYAKQGIYLPEKVTSTGMNTYILWLEKNGCAPSTISRYIASMKSYFHYLLQMGRVKKDPTMLLKGPVSEKKNPNVLSVEKVDCLLRQPSGDSVKEVRDKAMLELLYATGMKVSELINLLTEDVNLNLGYIICKDKTKERIVPFGLSAKKAINRYMEESRPKLLKGTESEVLFLNCSGKKMSRQGFWKIIKHYGERAGIEEEITPQALRHSFAMHLVENGASLRAVQEMMGHSTAATTQIYANMNKTKLNEEYLKAHPRG